MDWFQLFRLVGVGLGGGTAAFLVVYLFANEIVVSGKAYARERERADLAEQWIRETGPTLVRVAEAIDHAKMRTDRVVEVVKSVTGQKA